jgi:WD40 repeat protein
MDSLLKTWDIQPFCSGKRLLKTFEGGKHSAEKGLLKCAWSPDGSMVTGGSADRMVHIWDEVTTQEVRLTEYCYITIWNRVLTHSMYDAALSTSGTHWMCQYGRLSPQGECDCIGIFG